MSVPYFIPDLEWLSDCCGAPPFGLVTQYWEMRKGGDALLGATGRCSKCKDNTNFTRQETKPTTKGK